MVLSINATVAVLLGVRIEAQSDLSGLLILEARPAQIEGVTKS